ncbi:MAG TPA: glycosyltransferase, partial [Solirubrobacteraceae bacterium]
MAKAPVAGLVKTRLCPPLSPEEAAAVAEAALADTLAAVGACRADRKIIALDGRPGPWLPEGFDVVPQTGRGLALRLANAWAATSPAT